MMILNRISFIAFVLLTTASFTAATSYTVPVRLLTKEQNLTQVLAEKKVLEPLVTQVNTVVDNTTVASSQTQLGSANWVDVKLHLKEETTDSGDTVLVDNLNVGQVKAQLTAKLNAIKNLLTDDNEFKADANLTSIDFLEEVTVENVDDLTFEQTLHFVKEAVKDTDLWNHYEKQLTEEEVSCSKTATIALGVLLALALVGIAVLAFLLFRKSD